MICIATVSFRLPKKARELAMAQDKRHVGWLIKQTNDELEHKINNEMRPMSVTMQQVHALITLASTQNHQQSCITWPSANWRPTAMAIAAANSTTNHVTVFQSGMFHTRRKGYGPSHRRR